MTRLLLSDFSSLTVVEGSRELLDQIPDHSKLRKINSLFEDFEPDCLYDSIILEHVLEHVENPRLLLERIKSWLSPFGRLFVGVPNGFSIHRLVAVKMGLLSEPCELNSRDHALGHRRVYVPSSLKCELEGGGWQVVEMGGVFFKPLSNSQIQDNWNDAMITGFYELGKDFPEYAAELYAICK